MIYVIEHSYFYTLSMFCFTPVLIDPFSFMFQIKHKMPSTRSQGQAQPTLAFPRRKSCRVPLTPKTPKLEKSPAPSPSKLEPKQLPRIGPLSPRRPAHLHTPLSPRHPAVKPASPGLQPRLPLSPRKRTGERRRTGQGGACLQSHFLSDTTTARQGF